MQPGLEPHTAQSQELPSRRELGSHLLWPLHGQNPSFLALSVPKGDQNQPANTSLHRSQGGFYCCSCLERWQNLGVGSRFNLVLPGLSASLWLQVMLFWGMLWSLKCTGDAEMIFAHLLLLQIKASAPTLQGSWECSVPAWEGGREGRKAAAGMEEGRLCLHNLSPSLTTCWTCKRSLFPWKRALPTCAAELGKFAFIKPPRRGE